MIQTMFQLFLKKQHVKDLLKITSTQFGQLRVCTWRQITAKPNDELS